MKITTQPEKIPKGLGLVYDLLNRVHQCLPIRAKEAMSVWGYLNFIAAVFKQAQLFGRGPTSVHCSTGGKAQPL